MPTKIHSILGDITKLHIEAIINAANNSLEDGGGINGAIHFAAGSRLDKECDSLNGCETGEAKITRGYDLPVKYIIHTVGPIYGDNPQKERELLLSCYVKCLDLAREYSIREVAFPAISTGLYGFPKIDAAKIAVGAVKEYIKDHPEDFDEIIFVAFDETNFALYEQLLLSTDSV